MKKSSLVIISALMALSMSTVAYAGQWVRQDGKWAYNDDAGNPIKEGWFTDVDGKVYNFNGGLTRSGWYQEGNAWYYFNPQSGERMSGIINDGDKTYFCNFLGVMQTGWTQIEGNYYYLEGNGEMVKDQLKDINGNKYYFHPDGHMSRDEWVKDNTYHTGPDGIIQTSTWIDEDNYVNGSGKLTDNTKTDKVKIDNKVFTLEEYKAYSEDATYRYYDMADELYSFIQDYRNEYNDDHVYNYEGDDDDYIDDHELPEFDMTDSLNKAAALRAAELASQQRASGARPDGRGMETVLSDYGVTYTNVAESVAFGQDDAEECFEDLEDYSTHTTYWRNKNFSKIGIGVAYAEDGKAYWVVLYVE